MHGGERPYNRRTLLSGMAGAGAIVACGVPVTADEPTQQQFSTGECIADWPGVVDDQLDLSGEDAVERGTVPTDGALVLYVHGMFGDLDFIDVGGDLQASALVAALAEQSLDVPLVAGMWPATESGGDPTDAAATLSTWLEARAGNYDQLVLLAHSLGAELVLESLTSLADTDVTVSSVGLLGGSPSPESVCADGDYAPGITDSVQGDVYNYHSEGDQIICEGAPFEDGDFAAIGCEGAACAETPANYVDVDLTGRVTAHCNYFKPAAMDFGGESAVAEIVERQFGALRRPNGVLRGTVSGPALDGPVAIEARNAETGGTIGARTVVGGDEFSLSLPPTTYSVRVEERGFQPVEQTVEVRPEATTTADIRLDLKPVTGSDPPRDLDGDGRYRDVRGDGTVDVADVQALFENLDSPAVQENSHRFNFQGDRHEAVTVFDVQALFETLPVQSK